MIEEKLIWDKFNLEALTVNQMKSFKALADGKDVFIGTKTGSGKRRGTRIVTLG
jgi:Lhr-like helicase